MKRNWILLSLCALLLGCAAGGTAAADYAPLEAVLPLRQVYTTTDAEADSLFHYILRAEDLSPLPREADTDGVFALEGAAGTGERKGSVLRYEREETLHFTFPRPGVYRYTLSAAAEKDGKKPNAARYALEGRRFTLSFYVENTSEGSLRLQTLTVENEQGEKLDALELDPSYLGPATPSPVPAPPPEPGPHTGDGNRTPLYAALTLCAAAGLGLSWFWLRKARKGRDKHGT